MIILCKKLRLFKVVLFRPINMHCNTVHSVVPITKNNSQNVYGKGVILSLWPLVPNHNDGMLLHIMGVWFTSSFSYLDIVLSLVITLSTFLVPSAEYAQT